MSAAEGGATWSAYTMNTFDDRAFEVSDMPENETAPKEVYADGDNTATRGRLAGDAGNDSGQLPGITKNLCCCALHTIFNRRDASSTLIPSIRHAAKRIAIVASSTRTTPH